MCRKKKPSQPKPVWREQWREEEARERNRMERQKRREEENSNILTPLTPHPLPHISVQLAFSEIQMARERGRNIKKKRNLWLWGVGCGGCGEKDLPSMY